MSSTPNPPERPRNPTQYGSESLYESTGSEEAAPLKAQLGEHLDASTREALHAAERSASSVLDLIRRNPVPALLAAGGLVWLLASISRRGNRY